ncbi:MAG: type IX secretion system protein PorQ, partial [Cytophagales bacterium]|nr:type IX secretion system protein PorQ [Cytophaga sp.]
SFTYQPFYADIKKSTLFAAIKLKKSGTVSAGLNYFNYGTINETDASGTETGYIYHPREYALILGYARTQGPFSMGLNTKFVYSSIGLYNAAAILFDLGVLYKHPKQQLTIGFVFKNAGFNLNNYVKGEAVNMPFDVQLGATYKPLHMPLRLSITTQQLNRWNVVYNDPSMNVKINLDGTTTTIQTTFSDNLLRHFVIGGEFLLTKNFHFRFGYNFLMRRELRIQDKSGTAGMSWGFMLRVKKFDIGFTRAYYSAKGGTTYLTLGVNINEWVKK